jgi:hypothetical protein
MLFQVYTFECYLRQEKITKDYRVKLQPGTFQKYRFSYTSTWGRGSNPPPPFVYTFKVHLPVFVTVTAGTGRGEITTSSFLPPPHGEKRGPFGRRVSK